MHLIRPAGQLAGPHRPLATCTTAVCPRRPVSVIRPATAPPPRYTATAAIFYLGQLTFPSKKAAKELAQGILYSHRRGEAINPGHSDFRFLWHLWHHSPDYVSWHHDGHRRDTHKHAKASISHFSTNVTQPRPNLPASTCFYAGFADGSKVDFSYTKALDNLQHKETTALGGWQGPAAPKSAAELPAAAEQSRAFAELLQSKQLPDTQPLPDMYYHRTLCKAVWEDIRDFKEEVLNTSLHVYCPLTGQELWSNDDCHVDHFDPPFVVLVDDWLHQEGIQLWQVKGMSYELKASWCAYHQEHAKLRLLSMEANLSQSYAAKQARVRAAQKRAQVVKASKAGEE